MDAEYGVYLGEIDGGFTNGLGPVPLRLYLAAFGPRMLRLAGAVADGLALNYVGPAALPTVTVWTHITVEPTEADVSAARRFVGGYLRAPGYDRILARQGFGDAVEAARTRSAKDAVELVTDEMLAVITGFGSVADARARVDAYREQGVEVALMAGAARPGEGTARTLEALAPRPPS